MDAMKRLLIVMCASSLMAAACSSGDTATTTTGVTTTTATTAPAATSSTTTPPPPTSAPPVVTTQPGPLGWAIPAGLRLEPFAAAPVTPAATEPTAPYPGPATPRSLSGVSVAAPLEALLDRPGVRAMLATQGFAVIPDITPLFHQAYLTAIYDPFPVYVTTDAAYHSWHLIFDKILRETEQQVLLPVLDRLAARLVDQARLQAAELAGTELADAASRVAQFYEAAATVLELDVGPIGPLATAEVALVLQASEFTESPITSSQACTPEIGPNNCVDYSLYKPRGHYTRNADLERYFRAMSVLGNTPFFLDVVSLRMGLLASRVLLSDPGMIDDWQTIYEPTAFLVGAADDYTPFEAATAAAQVTPDGLTAPIDFGEDGAVAEVARELLALRQVQIDPAAASVRVMGVRFVLDSYIYDQLMMPVVADRWTASPLDMAAAFGSEFAYDTMNDLGLTGFAGYDEQLAKMRSLVASRSAATWTATVYDAWLHALEPMWRPRGESFPDYMRSEAWTAKSHQTGLGSYTELKHDTILYAKQAIAEGGGDAPADWIRHWVEPDPVPFARLGVAAALLKTGLAERELLPVEYESLLVDYEAWVNGMADIAAAELRNEPIPPEIAEDLVFAGGFLEGFWLSSSDWELDPDTGPDSMAALVADILRNPDAVLELGTGYIDTLLVVVPDAAGGFEIAKGGVYSYYEFWREEGDRLTDEQWRALLTAGEAPPRPSWQEVFLAGS